MILRRAILGHVRDGNLIWSKCKRIEEEIENVECVYTFFKLLLQMEGEHVAAGEVRSHKRVNCFCLLSIWEK